MLVLSYDNAQGYHALGYRIQINGVSFLDDKSMTFVKFNDKSHISVTLRPVTSREEGSGLYKGASASGLNLQSVVTDCVFWWCERREAWRPIMKIEYSASKPREPRNITLRQAVPVEMDGSCSVSEGSDE
ncbi:hypothetical protein HPB48_006061 [Haemaphysalis longicornis]|uniref:Uncharacterized protein n=1 Tax=Haemaphysalis longicornis TaxID=44386 RepID=A0A9J6GK67_HAELO|nr:hypothetical protein HPB48_006061 [Haemaphysalis longicornis]